MKFPATGRAYYNGRFKRCVDLLAALVGLVVLSPLLAVLAVAVLASSGPPVLFLQERVGRLGRPFRLLKFRTMSRGSGAGLAITGAGDRRVTRLGRFLRAAKLDEIPQLVNVLRGEMSLVGPRPEVPRYVERYDPVQRGVLDARPGLTDPATVLFRNEESLLGKVEDPRKEIFYVNEILPRKLAMNLEYLQNASFSYDLVLVLKTLVAIARPSSG
jgi:lipopolysaccharide/colanic/teichoic acid biosynthesis glycosyltransferase